MSKREQGERNDRKLESSDYENILSQHSIFETARSKHQELPSFPGFSNAETQTKSTDLKGQSMQSGLGTWHYNPWWMLASTSRTLPSQDDYSENSEQAKVKQEPSGAGTPDRDPLQIDVEPYRSGTTPPPGMDSFCDDCSDPFCDSSTSLCRKLFHCPHCRKSYPTILEFNTHLTGVHPAQKPFRCQICLEPFHKKSHLRRHLDSSHSRKDVNKCSVCSKYIKDKSNLRKHMQVHTGRVPQKQFKCDMCNNKRYMSLDRLNNHKVVCTGEKILKYCDMCTKVFDNSRSLNSHKKVHARELKCDICGEQLRSLEQFANHKIICQGTSSEASGSQSGSASAGGSTLNRCCTQPGLCEHAKLCPEGLLFNPNARFNYPCGYPIDIDCGGRPKLQPAQPSNDCPHQYGYFKVGDQTNCGQFMNCAEGVGYTFDCPEGLAFNSQTYRCDWPDQVPDCDVESFLGFSCPPMNNELYTIETKFFRSPNDCQHYFICVGGRPRLQNCGENNAFNELINACDAAENVTGCEPGLSSEVPTNKGATQRERTRLF